MQRQRAACGKQHQIPAKAVHLLSPDIDLDFAVERRDRVRSVDVPWGT
jgi:hypothetical protein